MANQDASFFMPVSESCIGTRADLFFGLRGASRFYNEVVVPGIAGVRFVRQLSWAVAALSISEQIKKPPVTIIANGIEALGSKLEWEINQNYSFRGMRAFKRYSDEWTFEKLSTRQGYVYVPYRVSTVRALPQFTGLGMALGGAFRYNDMELSEIGRDLAAVILDGKGGGKEKIRSFIVPWVRGVREIANKKALTYALSPSSPTVDEQKIVLNCLMTVVELPFGLPNDAERRLRLVEFASVKQKIPFMDWLQVKNSLHAKQVRVAQNFEEYRNAILNLYSTCTNELSNIGAIGVEELVSRAPIDLAFQKLTDRAKIYTESAQDICPHSDAMLHAGNAQRGNNPAFLKELVQLDDRILRLVDGKICKGALFRNMQNEIEDEDGIADEDGSVQELGDAVEKFPHHRLAQFYALLSDCGVGGGL